MSLPNYTGYDLLMESIDAAKERRPDRRFEQFNAIAMPAPKADLIICRDFLVHLTLDHIKAVLGNFKSSGSKWLAATHFPAVERNEELVEWFPGFGWRKLNMTLLGLDVVDSVQENEGEGKTLALFKL